MITVVTGPPAGGKTTYLMEHAKPGDIRVDMDDLASTVLGLPPGSHDYPDWVVPPVKAARRAIVGAVLRNPPPVDAWIIHTNPGDRDMKRYREAGCRVVKCDPGRVEVFRRLQRLGRPAGAVAAARRWYGMDAQTTSAKGLGWTHQKQRAKLMRRLVDGTPCPWCGRPMHKKPELNFDRRPLAADHTQSRAEFGTRGNLADRLMHFTCNSQRGEGRDYLKPGATPTVAKAEVKSFEW